MSDERAERDNPPQSDNGQIALSTLESAESYVAASTRSGGASDGSGQAISSPFNESFSAFLCWGESVGLIRPQEEFPFFQRRPDGFGDEHQAWFDESCNRWYKATYSNRFGIAWGRKGSATAGEYLTRLVLANQFFGDDIQLVALVDSGQKLRVLTSQPHVAGEAADQGEIRMWFSGLGFIHFESNGSIAWYRKPDNLLVADAHEGNVIRTPMGTLFAIDVNIIRPSREMLELVFQAIKSSSAF